MNTRRLATVALCQSVIFASCIVVWPQALSSTEIDSPGAAPVVDVHAAPPPAAAAPAQATQAAAADAHAGGPAEAATTASAATIVPEAPTAPALPRQAEAMDLPQPAIQTASVNPSETLPTETSSSDAVTAGTPAHEPNEETDAVKSSEASDECFVIDICVDRYLWDLYQRAPKEDTIRVPEQRQVAIKKKRKLVMVTRTFFRSVDENFAWKDRKASEKAGLSMADYVIGGMDRDFKLKLFYALHAAEAAGLSPGITSAFRDDYRQSIASGLKAANNRSYHGGSLRGGYGHGLAADIVSTKGATRADRWASTEVLWKWVDAHGKDFGIGRPYLDHDPPHVGPIDGQEYISRRGGPTTTRLAEVHVEQRKKAEVQVRERKDAEARVSERKHAEVHVRGHKHAEANVKQRKHLAERRDHGAAKHTKVASAKAGKVRSARTSHARARAT